jgi:hypothetical protein
MFDWHHLVDAPQRLTDRHYEGDWRRGVSNALRAKVVRIPGPRNAAITLPRRIDDFVPLEDALFELPVWLTPSGAAGVAEQLFRYPARIFPLLKRDEAENGLSGYAFVGAFAVNGEPVFLAIGRLSVAKRSMDSTIVDATIDWLLPPGDDLNVAMAALWLEARPDVRNLRVANVPTPQPCLWLGGSRGEVPGLPADWTEQLRAHAAARGFDLVVVQQPAVAYASLSRLIQQHAPVLAFAWCKFSAGTEEDARLENMDVVRLYEETFEDVLLMALLEWDEAALNRPAEAAEEPVGPDFASVRLAHEQAELDFTELIFLDEARQSAAESPYQPATAVYTILGRMNEIARRWLANEITPPLDAHFREAGLVHSNDISTTSKIKFGGHYERTYEGSTIRLGPHVKRGRGSPRQCLRIYYWRDETQRRIVVGHIGRHLPTQADPH